ASVTEGKLDGQLDAMDRRREAGDEEPASRPGEDFFELRTDGEFAGRVAGALDVGRILKECKHPVLAVFSEGVQVKKMLIGRCRVDLEVSSVDQHSDRRMDRERDTIDETVRHADGIDRERTDSETRAWADLIEVGVVEEAMFFEFVLDERERELGAVNGNVE